MTTDELELAALYTPEIQEEKRKTRADLILISMVRNEGDIISMWTSHVCSLFDVIFIVDHMSSDGTREFLLDIAVKMQNVYLYSFDLPGYFQQEITNRLAQMASSQYPESWLFSIDADEFLAVGSKPYLAECVQKVSVNRILRMHWKNCVPVQLVGDEEFCHTSPCLIPPHRGMYKKLGIHSSKFIEEGWRFSQGNHEILTAGGKLLHHGIQTDFCDILHVPLRSLDQFVLKCVQGFHAYITLPQHRNREGQGFHWFDMITDITKRGVLDPDTVRERAVNYGQSHLSKNRNVSIYDLIDEGWASSPLEVAHAEEWKTASRQYGFRTLAKDLVAKANAKELEEFMNVVCDGERSDLLREQMAQPHPENHLYEYESGEQQTFGKLSEDPVTDTDLGSGFVRLSDFLSKAFLPHQSPVPSAWEAHVPFLFCLLHHTKPRRFVELGSHYGNSYFAACQASTEMDCAIECIAIDTWQGDEHAGRYGNDVFQQFLTILKRDYQKCGKYVRKTFDEASEYFEPNSIDLLHIDGLHTYQAVSHDFATWLPKMSDRGIILFHDTQVFDRGFGVWKLWNEIRNLYPSFEFEHGHGLGMLLTGQKAPPRIQELFNLLSHREHVDLMRVLFSGLGKLSPIT